MLDLTYQHLSLIFTNKLNLAVVKLKCITQILWIRKPFNAETNTAVNSSTCLTTLSTGLNRNQQQITVTLVFKYFAKLEKIELSMVKQNVSNKAIKRTPIS